MTNKLRIYTSLISLLSISSIAQADSSQQYDWSGSYVGGSLGALHSKAEHDASTTSGFTGSYFNAPSPRQIAEEADKTSSQSRMSAGLFGGYGKQYDNLYVGVEASVNSLSLDDTSTSGDTYIIAPSGGFTNEISVKANWQAALRSRVGWADKRWLAYFTGGLAASQISVADTYRDDFGAYGQNSDKETKLGWTIGVGAEYALNDDWTLRGEYSYADYGDVDTTAFVTNTAQTSGNDLKSSVGLTTQIFSLGLSYHF